MGGYGSGRSATQKHVALVHKVPRIDVRRVDREWRELGKADVFRLTWRNRAGYAKAFTIERMPDELRVRADQIAAGPPHVQHSLSLVSTSCHFGGHRLWFVCPAYGCGRRVATLYYYYERFACRACFGLSYVSQRTPSWGRSLEKAQRIRETLGGSADMSTPFPDRPKGLHKRTYECLRREHHAANANSFPSALLKRH